MDRGRYRVMGITNCSQGQRENRNQRNQLERKVDIDMLKKKKLNMLEQICASFFSPYNMEVSWFSFCFSTLDRKIFLPDEKPSQHVGLWCYMVTGTWPQCAGDRRVWWGGGKQASLGVPAAVLWLGDLLFPDHPPLFFFFFRNVENLGFEFHLPILNSWFKVWKHNMKGIKLVRGPDLWATGLVPGAEEH